jgi:hypothetical protein
MSDEEYLTRKYCEPRPYWHCLRELAGGNCYSSDELNCPEYWLDAVAKYIGQKPSTAVTELYRRVATARAEFRAKQDRIYGNRKVSETEGLEDIYRRDNKAWDAFDAHKNDCLRAYVKAIETGKIERQRARRRHRCQGEECRELLAGRAAFCDSCKRARHRAAVRVYRRNNQPCRVISYTRGISPQNRALRYPDTRKSLPRQLGLMNARPEKGNSQRKSGKTNVGFPAVTPPSAAVLMVSTAHERTL